METVEEKEAFINNEEDVDLDTPVDPTKFEALKVTRNRCKKKNADWITDFKRTFRRDPT